MSGRTPWSCTASERPTSCNCFKLLIGVSGVGPKAALSILSAATPESLAMAIITGDEKSLTVAPGVGKKIAQRIILELKDKLAKGPAPATRLELLRRTGGDGDPQNKATEAAAAWRCWATPAPRWPRR